MRPFLVTTGDRDAAEDIESQYPYTSASVGI